MRSADAQKRAVGEAAAELVESGMTVGLGTGSTAAEFVRALGARRLDIRGVPTSEATAGLAEQVGIRLTTLDDAGEIDLTVDGADEIDPALNCIKGAGGALLREKLVWEASRRCVVIADAAKRVAHLGGAASLPIEVVAFAHAATARRIAEALRQAGLSVQPRLRETGGAPVLTDGGNLIYDAHCRRIDDPLTLGPRLKALTGVVEHGLFLTLATEAIIADAGGLTRLGAA